MDEVLRDLVAEGMVAELGHPVLGSYRGFAQPWVYSRTPGPPPFAAPALGQHNAQVRGEAAQSWDRPGQEARSVPRPGGDR